MASNSDATTVSATSRASGTAWCMPRGCGRRFRCLITGGPGRGRSSRGHSAREASVCRHVWPSVSPDRLIHGRFLTTITSIPRRVQGPAGDPAGPTPRVLGRSQHRIVTCGGGAEARCRHHAPIGNARMAAKAFRMERAFALQDGPRQRRPVRPGGCGTGQPNPAALKQAGRTSGSARPAAAQRRGLSSDTERASARSDANAAGLSRALRSPDDWPV